ncbi:MAG: hypothetical protein IJV58_10615 [Oscillospiraceae bacterium]|nr:hypothetical protein [Oscillospiraceae bacterium]
MSREKRKTHPAVRILLLLIPIAVIALAGWLYTIAGVRVGSESEYGKVYRIRYQGHTGWQWYLFDRSGNLIASDIDQTMPYIYDDGQTVYVVFYNMPTPEKLWYDDCEDTAVGADLDTGELCWDVMQERPDFCGMTQWKSYRPKELESPSEFVTLLDLTQENIPYYYFMVKNTEHKILYDADSEALPEIAWQDDETLIVTPVWDGEPHPMDFEPYVEQPWLDEKGEFP